MQDGRRRLTIIGIDVVVNITGVTATDASSANTALTSSTADGTLLSNIQSQPLLTASITSSNIVGNNTLSESPPTTSTAPPTPPSSSDAPPVVSNTGSGSVTLTWEAPSDNGGSTIIGYRISSYLDAVAVHRVSLRNTSVSSGSFRIGTTENGPWTSCLAYNVDSNTMKNKIDALDPLFDVAVTSNLNDVINGQDTALTWSITFYSPIGPGKKKEIKKKKKKKEKNLFYWFVFVFVLVVFWWFSEIFLFFFVFEIYANSTHSFDLFI